MILVELPGCSKATHVAGACHRQIAIRGSTVINPVVDAPEAGADVDTQRVERGELDVQERRTLFLPGQIACVGDVALDPTTRLRLQSVEGIVERGGVGCLVHPFGAEVCRGLGQIKIVPIHGQCGDDGAVGLLDGIGHGRRTVVRYGATHGHVVANDVVGATRSTVAIVDLVVGNACASNRQFPPLRYSLLQAK